jgi:intein/homing endonuclease
MEHLEEDKLKTEIINELNNLNDSGILFNSIEYRSSDGLNDFISNLTDEQAKLCLIEAVKYSFLRGIYSANGSVLFNKNNLTKRISFKTASKKIVEQLQLMLSSIGIRSYHTMNKETSVQFSNGVYTCKQSYDINISGKDVVLFSKLIGFIQKYKTDKLNDMLVEILDKSRSVNKTTFDIIENEYVCDEDVYSITVDNESHSYWSYGFNTGNCGEMTLENYEMCNLVETYPSKHESSQEYINTLKYAYL